jgi:hypothetical protein
MKCIFSRISELNLLPHEQPTVEHEQGVWTMCGALAQTLTAKHPTRPDSWRVQAEALEIYERRDVITRFRLRVPARIFCPKLEDLPDLLEVRRSHCASSVRLRDDQARGSSRR